MNRFSYQCTDQNGEEVVGFLNAHNDESARIRLMEQGLKVIRLDQCSSEETNTQEPDHASEITVFSGDQLTEYGKEAWNTDAEFIDQISRRSELNYHEMPLSASLHTLAEETSSRKLSQSFRRIALDLEQGISAEESFSQHLNNVPDNLESLIRVGAQSGKLEAILEDYIESQRLLRQSQHRILISLFYSGVLITGTCALFYFLMAIIVPNFQSLLNDFGVELPGITILAIHASELISAYGLKVFLILITGFLICWFTFDIFHLQDRRRRLINRIPVVGSILKFTSVSQFCRILATMIEAQIRLPEAIELAAKATKDPNLIAGCHLLIERLKEGFNLSEATLELPHFSKSFLHIFRWQNRPDLFIDSLRASSNIFQAKANMKTGTLLFGLQPVVLIGIILSIGLPVVAIYLPLIRLLQYLS